MQDKEKKILVSLVAVYALIASFDQWGEVAFSFTTGMFNYGWSFVLIGLSLLISDRVRRMYAASKGAVYELGLWPTGLGLGTLVTFMMAGGWKLYLGPTFSLKEAEHGRLGKKKSPVSVGNYCKVGLLGILTHFALANFGATGWIDFLPAQAVHNMIMFNLVFAWLSLIPIPPMDGSKIIYYPFTKKGFMIFPAIIFGLIFGYWLGFTLQLGHALSYFLGLIAAIVFVDAYGRVFK